ncbi:MAG: carbohydrate-binding protein [Pseudomonadota bacterium]
MSSGHLRRFNRAIHQQYAEQEKMMHIYRCVSNTYLSIGLKPGYRRELKPARNPLPSHPASDDYAAVRSWPILMVMSFLTLVCATQPIAAQLTFQQPGIHEGIIVLPKKPSTPRGLIHIEAEDFALNAYRIENNPIASGGKLISLRNPNAPQNSPSNGTATTRFKGLSGTYTVVINYLDEEDGSAQLGLKVGGVNIDSWSLDQSLGSGDPLTKLPFTARTIGNVSIKRGDVVTLSGSRDNSEHARVDFVQFIHLASRMQAENAVLPPESIIKTKRPGFTGTGYVDTIGEGFIEWRVGVPKPADYTLEFRYTYAQEGVPVRPLDILVNNKRVVSQLKFPNTIVSSRWLTEKAIVKLKSGSNTVRAVTTGHSSADMDYLSVTPVKYINTKQKVTPRPDPYHPEHGDFFYRLSYYGQIDPDGERKTLAGWKAVNGFSIPSNRIISASYINAFDLGFGREMHCRETGAGRPACYVDNYINPKGESKLVATVAMETRTDASTDRQFTAFYAFDSEGKRVNSAALDGEGPKNIPESCYACHMGYTTGGLARKEHGGQFLPFDQNLFENWPGKPTVKNQRQNISTLNALIWNWGKWFDDSIQTLIGGWYDTTFTTNFDEHGNRTFNKAFDNNYIPSTWFTQGANTIRKGRERILYADVYAKYCRTCHIAQGKWGVFSRDEDQRGIEWEKAIEFEKDAYRQICDPGTNQPIMPHAELTFERFNNDKTIAKKVLTIQRLAAAGGGFTGGGFTGNKITAKKYLCSQPPPVEPPEEEEEEPAGDKTAGGKIFNDAKILGKDNDIRCANCHNTTSNTGTDLSCDGALVERDLGNVRAAMNSLRELTEQEVEDLRAYLNSPPVCP